MSRKWLNQLAAVQLKARQDRPANTDTTTTFDTQYTFSQTQFAFLEKQSVADLEPELCFQWGWDLKLLFICFCLCFSCKCAVWLRL